MKRICLALGIFIVILFAAVMFFGAFPQHSSEGVLEGELAVQAATTTPLLLEKYGGPVRHIFFHSLIIYPEKAQKSKNAKGYADYMITVDEFKSILDRLYKNNFVLIDQALFYSVDENGSVKKQDLLIPVGKKPLILSLDDLSYYSYMEDGGFASKLVLRGGEVRTEVATPQGVKVTADGDVVPIVDEFVKVHPDFSYQGAKGVIALTGFEGILGYKTYLSGERGDAEKAAVAPVVAALKRSGWTFASHSFSHSRDFLNGTISEQKLEVDIDSWKLFVEPLVGKTDVFVGPFGQIFKANDPRRKMLYDAGFRAFYSVGIDGYLRIAKDGLVMDRIDIDGYRLRHNAKELGELLGI